MKNIVIDENSKNLILQILKNNLPPEIKVYAFGSRTKGTTKRFADLDLALRAEKMVNQSVLDKLNIAFENSLIPFKIDLIDLNNIDEEFLNTILPDLVLIL